MLISCINNVSLNSFGQKNLIAKIAKKTIKKHKNTKRNELPFAPQVSKKGIDLNPDRWAPLDKKLKLIDNELSKTLKRNDVFNFSP